MSQNFATSLSVGNDFVSVPKRQPRIFIETVQREEFNEPVALALNESVGLKKHTKKPHFISVKARYSIIVAAVLVVLIGLAGSRAVVDYQFARYYRLIAEQSIAAAPAATKDLTFTVPSSSLQAALKTITSQSISLSVGGQTSSVSASTIGSWLKALPDGANKSDTNLFVNVTAMQHSLLALASSDTTAPVNQVSVTHSDGVTPSGVIVAGQNGTTLASPSGLSNQVAQAASKLTSGKGMSFNASLTTLPYQALTPSGFTKLIEVDLTTKRLYAYQGGQLVNTFLISAGKPSTPTPIGEFHIWDKLLSQTMVGPGYVQPNVPYVNYFDHSGDAIHGVYWRPASAFGSDNLSHGCVGLEVPDAEWVYNWAPIGTTVIIHD